MHKSGLNMIHTIYQTLTPIAKHDERRSPVCTTIKNLYNYATFTAFDRSNSMLMP
jgi:hypothetical protein